MNEESRAALYLLGVIPQLLFGLRLLIQWLVSESRGNSCVPLIFWQLSLPAYFLMSIHAYIQLQYHLALVQGCSLVIVWRNLDLMGARRYGIVSALVGFITVICLTTFLFIWSAPDATWFRTPHLFGSSPKATLSWPWHLLGTIALILFSSRFWIQWWMAERKRESHLGLSFWWVSISANVLLFIYFWRLGDFINWIGPIIGFIPCLRNITLIRRTATSGESHG